MCFLEPPAVGLLGLRIFELPAVGLSGFSKQLPGRKRVRRLCERLRGKGEMPEVREEDMREAIPIPMKPLVPAIPKDDEELQELGEDLRRMGCEGLLGQPWNVQEDLVLREFKFDRGNQWLNTKKRDLENWTPDTWARVYGFLRGVGEGWAGRKDGLFARKFRGEVDPKEGLHPSNCRNPREQRMLEFLMPIRNPEKPKRISLTMANTLFGAMSGVRPVNWWLLIHEIVTRAIPNIGRKSSYLSPFLLHLYRRYDCIMANEDLLVIAAEKVAYKVRPLVADSNTSSDPIIPDAPPSSPGSPPPMQAPSPAPSSRRPVSPPPPPRQPHPKARPNRTSPWRNVDFSSWDFPENPFKRVHDELDELHGPVPPAGAHHERGQRGVGRLWTRKHSPGDSEEGGPERVGPGEEGARPSQDRKCAPTRADGVNVGRAGQKSEEIRKYHAEQTVVFTQIRELIGHPGKIVNKDRLYDQLAEETGDSEDEVIPSPNMRRAFIRMQAKASPGSSSLVGGLDRNWKERATPKKPRPS
jgi:hypothetical protein